MKNSTKGRSSKAGAASPPSEEELAKFVLETILPYKGDDCLEWPWPVERAGDAEQWMEAEVWIEGQPWLVRRFVCQQVEGPPPSFEHHAERSCGNDKCYSPGHLFWKKWQKPEESGDEGMVTP